MKRRLNTWRALLTRPYYAETTKWNMPVTPAMLRLWIHLSRSRLHLLSGDTRASQRELAAALHIATAPPPSSSPDANGSSAGPPRNPNTASVCEAQFLKARVEVIGRGLHSSTFQLNLSLF